MNFEYVVVFWSRGRFHEKVLSTQDDAEAKAGAAKIRDAVGNARLSRRPVMPRRVVAPAIDAAATATNTTTPTRNVVPFKPHQRAPQPAGHRS